LVVPLCQTHHTSTEPMSSFLCDRWISWISQRVAPCCLRCFYLPPLTPHTPPRLLAKLRPTTTPNMQLALPEEPAEEEFDEWAESPKEGWADIVRVRRAARTQEARRREAAACMIQVRPGPR
jgi:hypothetical protein